ncbi:radical SAM enzyme [Apiospora phragmitis]|uniref:Radical SAM enzyme n=1 Tax=Apiospora phragmitis TaxID=2905665 RepID=A0ABR1T4B3_9PEZI
MGSSYLLLDEYLCFLDKGAGVEKQSPSLLDVGVQKGLSEVYWGQKASRERGGIFEWTKDALGDGDVEGESGCGTANKNLLDW